MRASVRSVRRGMGFRRVRPLACGAEGVAPVQISLSEARGSPSQEKLDGIPSVGPRAADRSAEDRNPGFARRA